MPWDKKQLPDESSRCITGVCAIQYEGVLKTKPEASTHCMACTKDNLIWWRWWCIIGEQASKDKNELPC